VRRELGVNGWSVLGQSFGGFCVATYLSIAPEGLREAFFTGGVPPVGRHIDEVYHLTYERVLERCRRYYARYPEDRGRVRDVVARLDGEDVRLPSGDRLTARRFRHLGSLLGMSDGAEVLHYIVERPPDSPGFLHDVERATTFARNPLYAIVHEACYADGCMTNWSADRLLPADYEAPEFLTGEHIYPWMFEESALAPLREAADILAVHEWPRLYDADRLRENEVPAAAAIYAEDMYVERVLSEETAALTRNLRPWVTNEYEHNGLRADGRRILDRLIALARGRA
jgi:pimeloyl-ACP methyl ester carboxylesterase